MTGEFLAIKTGIPVGPAVQPTEFTEQLEMDCLSKSCPNYGSYLLPAALRAAQAAGI